MQPGTVPASPLKRSVAWQRCRRLAIVLGVMGICYLLHPFLLVQAGRWLNVGESLRQPMDYVYVLGGEASTRPFLAAAIYRAGYANTVLIAETQVTPIPGEAVSSEHKLTRAILVNRGVPENAIVELPGPVDSTRDEAQVLGTFLASRPTATVAVVTSDFHTRRTRLTFRRMLPKFASGLHFVATPTDGFNAENWWYFTDGVIWYTTEYAKLVRDFVQLQASRK